MLSHRGSKLFANRKETRDCQNLPHILKDKVSVIGISENGLCKNTTLKTQKCTNSQNCNLKEASDFVHNQTRHESSVLASNH